MRPTVLIVDDSVTVRMDLIETFEAAGFATRSASSLAEARAALARGGLDLLMVDVQLPDGDGIDLVAEVRRGERRHLPIMVLSSEAEVRDRVRGLRTGADDYVGKPYDAAYVLGRARELVKAPMPVEEGQRAKILIVDDSVTVREGLRSVLEDAGYEVLSATSGEEGLRLASAAAPDAVVVDFQLPGIDGVTVIRRLRQDARLRRVPCVLLTGSDGSDQLLALDSGADAYVQKSDGGEVVLLRLAALLRSTTARVASAEETLLAPKRLLVVDDSATFRHEVAGPLREEGYDVALAASGEEALELLAAQPVDCVLLDLLMPGLSGHETCRRIRSSPERRDVPVVVITGHDDRQALIESINAGADDYISKSADMDVLKARVRAQLRRKQFEDENRRIREELMRKELEATEARAARELALVLERKNRELSAQNLRVQEATRLKSEFLANMSHELRTPLNAIIGFSELMHDGLAGPLTDQQREFLGDVLTSSRHLLQLINDVLDLAKVEAGKMELRPEPLDLQQVVGEVRDVARSLSARKGVRLQVVVEPGLTATLDASKLKQVLYNFVSNAIKFTPEQGTVTLRARGHDAERLRVEVQDTGIGIAAADLDKLFIEFHQLDAGAGKRYQGTGLGLALTRRIVAAQGGEVGVESTPGEGSTFFALLPRVTRPTDAPDAQGGR